jgi:4-hydroxy-tetrahydrodipicolinate reductase
MYIALIGYGKMGKMIDQIAENLGHEVVARITSKETWDLEKLSKAEVCIEFTEPHSAVDNIRRLAKLKKNVVIGTTGWYDEMSSVQKVVEEHKIGAVYAPNFSLGMQLFLNLLKRAAEMMNNFEEYDVAGIEYHHRHKKDKPAGTALQMVHIVEEHMPRIDACPFSSVRCGSIPGTYTILFDSPGDTIALTHTARNRESYARGAIQAAEWLMGKKGLYTFHELLNEQGGICNS